jgi:hypothetical protein
VTVFGLHSFAAFFRGGLSGRVFGSILAHRKRSNDSRTNTHKGNCPPPEKARRCSRRDSPHPLATAVEAGQIFLPQFGGCRMTTIETRARKRLDVSLSRKKTPPSSVGSPQGSLMRHLAYFSNTPRGWFQVPISNFKALRDLRSSKSRSHALRMNRSFSNSDANENYTQEGTHNIIIRPKIASYCFPCRS